MIFELCTAVRLTLYLSARYPKDVNSTVLYLYAEEKYLMAMRVSQITHAAIEKLLNDGYAVIHFSHSHIPGVVEGWKRFLIEPQERKDEWTIDAEGKGDPDDGYIRRSGTLRADGIYDDHKEFFHYRYRLTPRLARKGISIDPHRAWVNHSLHQLHLQCASTSRMIASALDHHLVGYYFAERVAAAQAMTLSVLRLLSYDLREGRTRALIGKGHTDKCFLTFHIADERPGLQVAQETHPYRARSNTALLFFGDRAAQITGGKYKALWHEVIDTSKDAAVASSRWSIVYFCHIVL